MTRNVDGRKAVVIGRGHVFPTYIAFAKEHGYPDAAYDPLGNGRDNRSALMDGDEVTLLVSARHSTIPSYGTLWIVEKANGDRYIIEESGLDIKQPDVLGLIANLSTRLAEAERKIAELERSNFPKITTFGGGITYGTANYRAPSALTRDDVIEQAKADVARIKEQYCGCYALKFVVNRDKRTVVALIFNGRYLYSRGKSRCAPDDVFNTHIGRAIALRRALGLTVPDAYVNAPKPTEAKVGDIVTFNDHDAGRVLYRVDSLGGGWNCTVIYCDEKFGGSTGARGKAAGGNFAWARIVDDSRDDTEVTA